MSISLLLHPCVLPTQNAATRETPIQGEGCFLENGTASAGLGGVAFATTVIVVTGVTGVTDPCPHQLSLQVSPLCFCNFMRDATPVDPTLHKRSGSGAAQDPVGKEVWSTPETSTSFSQNEFLPPALWDGPMWSATTKWPAGVLKEGCCVRDYVLVCIVDADILWQLAGLASVSGRYCSWVEFKASISATMADIDWCAESFHLLGSLVPFLWWRIFHACPYVLSLGALQMSLSHPHVHHILQPHTSLSALFQNASFQKWHTVHYYLSINLYFLTLGHFSFYNQ